MGVASIKAYSLKNAVRVAEFLHVDTDGNKIIKKKKIPYSCSAWGEVQRRDHEDVVVRHISGFF